MSKSLAAVAVFLVAASARAAEPKNPVDPPVCDATQAPIVLEDGDDLRPWRVVAHVEHAAPRPTSCAGFRVSGYAWDLQLCNADGACQARGLRHALVSCGDPRRPGRLCQDRTRVFFSRQSPGLYILTLRASRPGDAGALTSTVYLRTGKRPPRAR